LNLYKEGGRMVGRYQIWDKYSEYNKGYPCRMSIDDEERAFQYKKDYPRDIVYDSVTSCFLE